MLLFRTMKLYNDNQQQPDCIAFLRPLDFDSLGFVVLKSMFPRHGYSKTATLMTLSNPALSQGNLHRGRGSLSLEEKTLRL